MSDDLEGHAREIGKIVGMEPYDLKLRIGKPGITLLASSREREPLAQAEAALREPGYKTVIIGEDWLLDVPRPGRAVRVATQGDRLALIDSTDQSVPFARIW